MEFNPELIKTVIYIAILVGLFVFIIKKAIKVALSLVLILAVFHIGFVMDGKDVIDTFKLNEIMDQENASKITAFFDDFDKKRKEFGIVETEKVEEKMKESISKGTAIFVQGLGQIDINAFAKNLSEKIYEVGAENINIDELSQEIQKQLDGISQEDLEKVMNKIVEYSTELKNNTSKNNE